MAKSDFLGGAFIFLIMFSIAMVQLYIFKHVKAFQVSRGKRGEDNNTSDCLAAGGKWIGNPEDPCCKDADDSLPGWVPRCVGSKEEDLNTRLGCPDSCAFAFDPDKCSGCPQPPGFGDAGNQGGAF